MMVEKSKNIQEAETDVRQGNLPNKQCMNCGTELIGMYCHVCGQEVVNSTHTVKGFIMEYIGNAYNWDSKFFHTIWSLIRRPGHLTNEFISGKFISHEHPLKLNMFLLFIFITLFVLFAGEQEMADSVLNLTNDERVLPGLQMDLLMKDDEYAKKLLESPRDTIRLHAPLFLIKNLPQIFSNLETIEDTKGETLDKWVAVIPHALIEDEYIVIGENGYYHFNTEIELGRNELDMVNTLWNEMVGIISQYFPMLLLLTTPFLSFSLSLVQRKSKIPRLNHFIFALHYTAFIEFLIICIYIIHLTLAPPTIIFEYALMIGSCTYLAIAYRRVYAISSWWKTIAKTLIISLNYLLILLLILSVIFIIACALIADLYI
jgi:hypothetical protein